MDDRTCASTPSCCHKLSVQDELLPSLLSLESGRSRFVVTKQVCCHEAGLLVRSRDGIALGSSIEGVFSYEDGAERLQRGRQRSLGESYSLVPTIFVLQEGNVGQFLILPLASADVVTQSPRPRAAIYSYHETKSKDLFILQGGALALRKMVVERKFPQATFAS